jgi:hypothetical protein
MAKNLLLPFFLILLFSFTNHRSSFYQTECLSIEAEGYIIIRIWNTQKGQNYKLDQARREAIYAILYSGISGSSYGCSTQPPILNNIEKQKAFKGIEKEFFAHNGQWSVLTRNASMKTTLPTHIGNKNWRAYQVSVSKNELRRYLEERKIIKSLSDGF